MNELPVYDDKISKLGEAIALYWNSQKDSIFRKRVAQNRWTPALQVLDHEQKLFKAIRNIIKDSRDILVNDDDTISVAKKILGYALAQLACITEEITKCYEKAHHWRVEAEFTQALRNLYRSDRAKILPLLEKISKQCEENPELFVLTPERKNFLHFFKKWLQNPQIQSVWSKNFSHFPIASFEVFLLTIPLPDDIETYIKLVSAIKAPMIVELLLNDLVANNTAPDISHNILAKAPSCTEPEPTGNIGQIAWNRSIFLPLFLKFVLSSNKSPEVLEQFTSKLAERPDGAFIAYNFTGYLLQEIDQACFGSNTQSRIASLDSQIDLLKKAFKESEMSKFSAVDLPGNIEEAHKDFLNTGIVKENIWQCSYLNLIRRQLSLEEPFTSEKSELIINKFENVLAIEDMEFHTSGFNTAIPEHKHYEIALLYATHERTYERWYQTWKMLFSARHRLTYHPSDRSGASHKVNFCLAVAIAIVDWKTEKSEFTKAQEVLTLIWIEIISIYREQYFVFQTFIERIIPLCLIRFYLIKGEKEKKATELSDFADKLYDLSESPQLLINTIDLLCNNGIELSINSRPPAFLKNVILLAIEQVKNDPRNQGLKRHYENWLKKLAAEPKDGAQNHVKI